MGAVHDLHCGAPRIHRALRHPDPTLDSVRFQVEPGTTTEVEMTEAGNGTNGNSSDNNGTEKTKSLPPWLSKVGCSVGAVLSTPVYKRIKNSYNFSQIITITVI